MAELKMKHGVDLDGRHFAGGEQIVVDAGTARALLGLGAAEVVRFGVNEQALEREIEEHKKEITGGLMHGGPIPQRGAPVSAKNEAGTSRLARRREYKAMGGVIGVRIE